MEQYAVIKETEYYGNDAAHPAGWDIKVAYISGEHGETRCVGSLAECRAWLERLNEEEHYLAHGEAGYSHRIVLVVDDDVDYQAWLDTVDWDDCPGDDYDDNCIWAEERARKTGGTLPVADNGRLYLVDLSAID